MSTTLIDAAVRKYLEAVRAQLVDLTDEDRDELLEDLEEHLVEVSAEEDGTLEERLGPPSAYAEELRASAGLQSRGRSTSEGLLEWLVRSGPVRRATMLVDSPRGRALRSFLHELGPGWWVLRGYLAVLVPAIITSNTNVRENVPYPSVGDSYPVGVAAVVLAAWVSVRLGRRAQRERKARFASLALTMAVVVATGMAFAGWRTGGYPYDGYDVAYGETQPFLQHADGSAIANICPYSSDGKLLSGVLLFDQGGRAIINTADMTDGFGIQRQLPAILNAYPLTVSALDEIGQPTPVVCPPSISAQPTPLAEASPAPGATAGD